MHLNLYLHPDRARDASRFDQDPTRFVRDAFSRDFLRDFFSRFESTRIMLLFVASCPRRSREFRVYLADEAEPGSSASLSVALINWRVIKASAAKVPATTGRPDFSTQITLVIFNKQISTSRGKRACPRPSDQLGETIPPSFLLCASAVCH